MTTDPDRRLLAALLLRAARDTAGDDPRLAVPDVWGGWYSAGAVLEFLWGENGHGYDGD